MEKLFGFMLFFIGIGMIIGMLIAENVVLVVSAGVFLLLGIIFSVINFTEDCEYPV